MSDRSEDRADGRTRLIPIAALLVFPAAILIFSELSAGATIWNFRAVDLADLVLLYPAIVFVLVYLLLYLWRYEVTTPIVAAFAAFSFVFVFGQGMHWAANSIDTFATEVNDYEPTLPEDLYSLVFFIDERFSHGVLFVGATGLITTWLVADYVIRFPPLLGEHRWLQIVLGVLYGGLITFGAIEARMAWMVIVTAAVPLAIWILFWRRSATSLGPFFWDRPFTALIAVMSVAEVLLTAVYGITYGGFPQPSEL